MLLEEKSPKLACSLLHNTEKPAALSDESTEDLQSRYGALDLEQADLLIVLGVGNAGDYSRAESWLQKKHSRYLIFVEMHFEKILSWVLSPHGKECINHPQVNLVHIKNWMDDSSELHNLIKLAAAIPFEMTTYHQKVSTPEIDQLQRRLMLEIMQVRNVYREHINPNSQFIKNFYLNLPSLPDAKDASQLKRSFANTPAIICGAGPSLEKQIPLLKTLQNQALIISGGGTICSLASYGIVPHFSVMIDPTIDEWSRCQSHSSYEVPTFYRPRLNHLALDVSHSTKLFFNGSASYSLDQWLTSSLDIPVDGLDEGHSCITFALDIALLLACNPISFVGVDLAFTEKLAYSRGVPGEALTMSPRKKRKEWEGACQHHDIYGKQIDTLWKWKAESEYIALTAMENHHHYSFYNSTEGGIGFPGIANQTLLEFKQDSLSHNYDLAAKVHLAIENLPPWKWKKETLLSSMKELLASFDRILLSLNSILDLAIISPSSKQISLLEIEINDEEAYLYALASCDESLQKIYSLKLNPWQVKGIQRSIRDLLTARRFTTLQELCQCHRDYLALAIETFIF